MYGCTLASPHTCLWFTYPIIAFRDCGIIYLRLLRVKVDASSIDRRMLSVSWGAQFLALFLPVNYIFFITRLVLRSVMELKCGKNLIYTPDFI